MLTSSVVGQRASRELVHIIAMEELALHFSVSGDGFTLTHLDKIIRVNSRSFCVCN